MILIIGGGITGLAVAFELARRDVPFLLLEKSQRPGGLIRTEHVDGFTLDAGPDSLLALKPSAIRLCEEIGLGSRLISSTPPRTAFVLKRGRLHPLPSPSVLGIPTGLAALAGYSLLTWGARARLALEPLVPPAEVADESVAAFFERRFGRATVSLIAEPLLGGIHAGRVGELSMRSLFPRLVEAEAKPGRVLRNLRSRGPADPDGLFRSLRSGMGELVEALVTRLPAGSIRLGAAVESLTRGSSSWSVATDAGTVEAAAVILAAPAHAAATLLSSLDPAAAQICATVPYVSTASIALGWRRADVPHPLAGSGFVVARRHNALRITACTWVSSKWPGRAPEGHVLLRAFVGGAHDPHAAALDNEELVSTAVHDVSATLGIAAPPVLARVYRWPDSGAQHTVGHRARMAALGERLGSLPGLSVAGAGFDSIGIPDCITHGRRAAAAAADYVTMGPP
ncbi:MAG: protoporphyrinogen oxidase [Acidobacteria bacterium]|nr:protoporphyrinogen oxidase [Acidobacteriota bacterium]